MTVSQVSAVLQKVFREERIPADRADAQAGFYSTLLEEIAVAASRSGPGSLVLGICGSQGSGKSTVAHVLKEALRELRGLSVATLSLDDLYLSTRERTRLAREVHPLLQTRGVPGTHDVDLGMEVIQQLVSAPADAMTRVPRFDKARDEPLPRDSWEVFHGRADVVIFEGWCVGARPQEASALRVPINELERVCDVDGVWRRYVNDQLAGRYQALFGLVHRLILLRAPSFEGVFEWRREQERKLAERSQSGEARTMSDEQLRRFIMHYERLTRHILEEMPARADTVVALDARRNLRFA